MTASLAMPLHAGSLDTALVADLIRAGKTLPSHWYTSTEIFRAEQRQIFQRSWTYAGHGAQVAKPGDYFTCELDGIPVVVCRGTDHTLRAFLNICRHRHHPIAQGAGNRSSFLCAYHAWAYRLDGTLLSAPRTDQHVGFDKTAICLKGLQVEMLGDMVFVNVSGDAPPLRTTFGPSLGRAHEHHLPIETARYVGHRSTVVDANWKIVWDNNSECYHCPTVHASWSKQARLTPDYYFDRRIGPYHYETQIDMYPNAPAQFAYYVWPRLFFFGSGIDAAQQRAADNACFTLMTVMPLAANKTLVDVLLFATKPMSAEQVQADLALGFSVIDEDKGVCETVQRSHETGAAEPGQLVNGMDTEQHTLLWQQYVLRSLAQPDIPLYEPIDTSLSVPS